MRVCFTPGQFVQCVPGIACTGAIECVAGIASNIVAFAAASIGAVVNATCVADIIPGTCDVATTTQTDAREWASWVTYAAEPTGVLYRPRGTLRPWGFLYPFSWQLWIAMTVFAMVATPMVAAVVQYDTGKTLIRNFRTFFPDVFHAHTDVDTFDRNNTSFSIDTAALSVSIAVLSKIAIALYACNLAAYVIFSDFGESATPIPAFSSVATTPRYSTATTMGETVRVFETSRGAFESYASGESDAVLESAVALAALKTCRDKLQVIRGPRIFDVIAFSTKSSASFEHAVRNVTTAFDAVSRVRGVTCPPQARSITLHETLGMFVTFGACMIGIAMIAIAMHVTRHEDLCSKSRKPESPASLPETIRV